MTVLEIECFLSICKHKTISRAAESLYITQPSLSSRLKTLERELGGKLFLRQKGSREITLTAVGKEFYKLAQQYQELIQKMQSVFEKEQDQLRISSLNSLDTFLLPQVYDRFLQEYPQIELEIKNMDLPAASQGIHAGDIDIAFTTGKSTDKTLKQTLIVCEPMVIVCNKGLKFDEPVKVEELQKNQELFVDWNTDFVNWHNNIFGDKHPSLTVSIMAHIKQFLESKQCWAIVPISVADGLQTAGVIKRVCAAFEMPNREISIVTSPTQDENTSIEKFCDCLKRTVSKYIV